MDTLIILWLRSLDMRSYMHTYIQYIERRKSVSPIVYGCDKILRIVYRPVEVSRSKVGLEVHRAVL